MSGMPGLPNLYAQQHASHKYRAHLPNAEMRGMRGHMEPSRDEKDILSLPSASAGEADLI
jgi:hypothetical protein